MDEFFAASAAGKVLDASAVAAWASGHVGMQTWFGIAWELQLSFYLPAFARSEGNVAASGNRTADRNSGPGALRCARRPGTRRGCSRRCLPADGGFTDDQLSVLPSVRNNLTGLAEVLTSPWGAGLPDTHCTMLTDPADRGMVSAHLMQVADQAQDLLLIYYAGRWPAPARWSPVRSRSAAATR